MADVLHKTADPVDYRESVNTPDYDPTDWFINPDVSAVAAVEQKYWKRPLTDPVAEMTQGEKDAVDAALASAATNNNRSFPLVEVSAVTGEGVRLRALIELFNKRDNYLTNRIAELQSAMAAMKASTGAVANLLDAIPSSWLPTNTRSKGDAIQDFTDDINAGNQDT